MDVRTVFFYVFAALLLFAAVRVITARNPVHAVLYLIFAFSQAAGIWLLLRAEFLAILLVMVYLGAVMVLFLFVVMMLDVRIERMQGQFKKQWPVALLIFAFVVGQMIAVLWVGFPTTDAAGEAIALDPDYNNTRQLGILMYSEYVLPIQVAGVILLVGMIAAIALTLRRRDDTRIIDPSLQIHVKAQDRLRIVQMAPVRAPAGDGEATQAAGDAAQEEKKS